MPGCTRSHRIIVTYDGGDVEVKNEEGEGDTKEYPCIIRATDGKKEKFSTHVSNLAA